MPPPGPSCGRDCLAQVVPGGQPVRLTLTGVTQGLGKLATVGMVSHPIWGNILKIALELGLIA